MACKKLEASAINFCKHIERRKLARKSLALWLNKD